ncbi:MAG: hypothetical protein Greene041679_296 [Parcubacteria group bacterium Greene0416_79]|nr:MAG: hypothetical protein Greene041679_296 [Parcubacteria group bacterium Greene0416_79]
MLERGAILGIKELYKQAGVEFNEAKDLPALREARMNRPEMPPFPILILLVALAKDGADMILWFSDQAALTGIGLLITVWARVIITALTLIAGLTIWLWIAGRITGMRALGSLTMWYVKRRIKSGVAVATFELVIPLLPLGSIYVLMAHHDQNKYVQIFDAAAGKLAKVLKGKFGK